MAVTPKASWGWGKAMLHSIYDQPETEAVAAHFDRLVDAVMVQCDLASGAMYTARSRWPWAAASWLRCRPTPRPRRPATRRCSVPLLGVDAPRGTTALRSASDLDGLFDLLVP
jgi:hypothetical protein